MKDQTFNGRYHSEDIYFKSSQEPESIIQGVKKKISSQLSGYYENTADETHLKFIKRRLFLCEYNLCCDIGRVENKYILRIYYTIENINWTYWLFGILTIFIIGSTKVLAKGDDTVNTLIFIGIVALVLWVTHGHFNSTPQEELYSECKRVKKELESYIKLELES